LGLGVGLRLGIELGLRLGLGLVNKNNSGAGELTYKYQSAYKMHASVWKIGPLAIIHSNSDPDMITSYRAKMGLILLILLHKSE